MCPLRLVHSVGQNQKHDLLSPVSSQNNLPLLRAIALWRKETKVKVLERLRNHTCTATCICSEVLKPVYISVILK